MYPIKSWKWGGHYTSFLAMLCPVTHSITNREQYKNLNRKYRHKKMPFRVALSPSNRFLLLCWLTYPLMPAAKHNLAMDGAMDLTYSLLMLLHPRKCQPHYVQYTHHGLTSVFLCVPVRFADNARCWFAICNTTSPKLYMLTNTPKHLWRKRVIFLAWKVQFFMIDIQFYYIYCMIIGIMKNWAFSAKNISLKPAQIFLHS